MEVFSLFFNYCLNDLALSELVFSCFEILDTSTYSFTVIHNLLVETQNFLSVTIYFRRVLAYDQSQGYGGFSLVAHNANPLEVKILCQLRKTFG